MPLLRSLEDGPGALVAIDMALLRSFLVRGFSSKKVQIGCPERIWPFVVAVNEEKIRAVGKQKYECKNESQNKNK